MYLCLRGGRTHEPHRSRLGHRRRAVAAPSASARCRRSTSSRRCSSASASATPRCTPSSPSTRPTRGWPPRRPTRPSAPATASGRCTACRSRSRTWWTWRGASPPAARRSGRSACRRSPPRWPSGSSPPGMIVLGKTHTVEFAMGSFGHQHAHGHAAQPVGPRRCTARRAARRAAPAWPSPPGLAPVAIGTDTGGSVRLPAAWCGIVGLKVTAGRISTYGVLPLSIDARHAGPAGALGRGRRADLPRAQRPRPARSPDARVDAGRSAAGAAARRRRPAAGRHARRRARRRRPPTCWPPTTRRSRRWPSSARGSCGRRCRIASATTRRPRAASSAPRAIASSATWWTT